MIAKLRSLILPVLVCVVAAVNAQVPVISYASPQVFSVTTAITPLLPVNTGGAVTNSDPQAYASGFAGAVGLAIDASGNLFVADANNNVIKEVPAGGGSPVIFSTAIKGPGLMTVDIASNLYVISYHFIIKMPAGGGPLDTLSSSIAYPCGIAVDKTGNVFVSEASTNNIYRIGTDGSQVIWAQGLSEPTGLRTDAAGNVYVSDEGDNAVEEIPAGGGAPVTLASGFFGLRDIALDPKGNIYVVDVPGIELVPPGGGAPVALVSAPYQYFEIVSDNAGNLFLTGENGQVTEVKHGGYSITPALPGGLSLDRGTGAISGTPTTTSPSTNYTVTATNTSGSGSAVLNITVILPPKPAISYSTPQTYFINTQISPLAPSNSGGAVGLPTETYIPTNFLNAAGLTMDVAGNFYVSDQQANIIRKIPPKGGSEIDLGYGFNEPQGVAVDSEGNIYVADFGNGQVKEIPANGGPIISIGTGITSPVGLAVDGQGNVYVSDQNTRKVFEILKSGGSTITLASGLYSPQGIALDGAGNIYVADVSAGLKKIPAKGGSPVVLWTPPLYGYVLGVGVDAAGNIYAGNVGNDNMIMLPATGGSPININGYSSRLGIVVTPGGNVYEASNYIIELTGGYYASALPAGLTINYQTGTISGTPTSQATANYSVMAVNLGGSGVTTVKIGVTNAATSLSGLTVSAGVLSPAFDPSTTNYTLSAGYYQNYINITPTTLDPGANIKVHEVPVASATTSQDVFLQPGVNTVNVLVTSPDGSSVKAYTITVTRAAPSANAALAGLSLSSGALSPAFSSSVNSYTSRVNNENSSIVLAPVTADPTAKVTVNGIALKSNSVSPPVDLAVGPNAINIVVTAQTGATQTYTLNVTRDAAKTNLAYLSNLTLSSGTLSPVFNYNTNIYTADVADTTTSVTVTPTAAQPGTTITINGQPVTSKTASAAIALHTGSNLVNVVVTNGTATTTYTVTIIRAVPPSTDAYLTTISITPGRPLTLVTGPGNTNYTATVTSDVASVTVTPVAHNAGSTITVNGKPVASGTVSQPISLIAGVNTITTEVTAQDGITKRTIIITITKAPSNDAYLSTIYVRPAAVLTPSAGPGDFNFTGSVNWTVTSVIVTATPHNVNATVTVNGVAVAPGQTSAPIALNIGANTITTVVTAQDGTTKSYIITLTRIGNHDAYLQDLAISTTEQDGQLSPAFHYSVNNYSVDYVTDADSVIYISSTPIDPNASIKIQGSTLLNGNYAYVPLSFGENVISVVVTAQDGITTQTYTITANRPGPSANDALSNLTSSTGLILPTGANTYNLDVAYKFSAINVTPTTADAGATVTINGAPVVSGSYSKAIDLKPGLNTITIVVTAQDGIHTRTYTITVTRQSNNAYLTNLVLSGGAVLSPAFHYTTYAYTASVPNDTTAITVTLYAADSTAELSAYYVVPDKIPSPPIKLAVGPNVITAVVISQDHSIVRRYSVTVTRAAIGADAFTPGISVNNPAPSPGFDDDVLLVHHGVSPNGDGINDFLIIDGIQAYPDNHLSIMNRNGQLVFEAKGYDNQTRTFDGHSNKTGQLQLPGTYFYQLDYTVKGITKHKTGYLVLKY